MARCAFLIPGDLELPTGGYAYDRRLLGLLSDYSVDVTHVALPGSFPSPIPADLTLTAAHVAALPEEIVLLIDGLAFGALPTSLLHVIRQPIVALCHHPLALEHGIGAADAVRLSRSEREALEFAQHIVVTGGETRTILVRDFSVPPERITVAVPGVDPAPRATGTGEPVSLLAVGSVVPRKGYGVLIEALAKVTSRNWQLTIAGASDRNTSETNRLRALISDYKLDDRVQLTGAVDETALSLLYAKTDVFVMSSFFEGYGMVLAEAMARGLPIVTTRSGSAASSIPDSAAIKVTPQAVDELAMALDRVIEDASLRQSMARESWLAGQQLPRWSETAEIVAGVIRKAAA
ncbi:MAG: glycosyltransferase family 4 protein [Hyphomicrobiaceae bacterium]